MNVDPMTFLTIILAFSYAVFFTIAIAVVVRMRNPRQHLKESRSNPDKLELAFDEASSIQRGSGNSRTIAELQPVRKVVPATAFLLGVLVYSVTTSPLNAAYWTHEMVECVGIVGIIVCILGQAWASLYVAGPKIEQFVAAGPYSVVRNPLYFFSILGAAGAGAQIGSIVAGIAFGVVAWALFYVLTLREERHLAECYGEAFAEYMAKVPRFLPDPRLWRDGPTLTIVPPKIMRMLAKASPLLLAAPLAEAFESLQVSGILPVLFRLP
jgi:protein-S-isoprenylcysteine O-methyltransferase Ste14